MKRWVGIPVGLLIGFASGLWTLFIMMDAFRPQPPPSGWLGRRFGPRPVAGLRVAAKVATLPMFWFGGTMFWFGEKLLTTSVLDEIFKWDDAFMLYACSVAVVYCALVAYPTIRVIIKLGNLIPTAFLSSGTL